MSGSASFTAIWLKPQLRHNISITAIAPGLSERAADETGKVSELMKLLLNSGSAYKRR